ncbi:MAG: DUF2892 domain-containing protein [Rhodobacteraceae bacterium]|nr:DUF2892 domain-containing protein [Paracoccaceae bacterium]
MFAKNIGTVDRVLRIVPGVILIALFLFYPALGGWKWAALVVGVIVLVTAFISTCPLYSVLGVHTNKS